VGGDGLMTADRARRADRQRFIAGLLHGGG
jgi:hypothetical protein